MTSFRGLATDAGWIRRELNDIKRQIREMRAEKRLRSSVLEAGENLLIQGILKIVGTLDLTGDLSMKSGAGDEIIRMGAMPQGDRGLEFKRENGISAFTLSKAFTPTDPQSWFLRDRDGTNVVAENAVGPGLFRPHLEHPFQPVAATSGTAVTCGPWGWERTHASTTWTTLFAYDGKAQNLFLDFKFAAFCSDGTTAGEIRVVDLSTGTPLNAFISGTPWTGSIVAGTTAYTVIDPTPDQVVTPLATAGVGGQMRLGVQVRRTGGTGTITLATPQAIGG